MVNNLIHIIRPINIILVLLSQALIYYTFISPYFDLYGIESLLNDELIALFLLDTALIAASGYIINDIKDISSDIVNKPTRTYVGTGKLSVDAAKTYYIITVVLGAFIAAYIAYTIDKYLLFIIYPLVIILLYMYSDRWKKRPLSGNIVVSLFCAFVPGIIWYAESEGFDKLYIHEPYIVVLFGAYILFGFFATFTREVIKDLEDLEGDGLSGYKTFPITAGESRAQYLALTNLIATLGTFAIWLWALMKMNAVTGFWITIFLLVLPTIYLALQTTRATEKRNYSRLSRQLKYLLAVSLFTFLITVSQI